MDEVNISVEELVLDGASALSPEHLRAALLQAAPAVAEELPAHIAAAVADHLSSRLGGQPL